MFLGDRSRKKPGRLRIPPSIGAGQLVSQFPEFQKIPQNLLYVSATPAEYEMEQAGNRYTELIIRPTGLVDPKIEVRPVLGQVDDMLHEIRIRPKNRNGS